jgi:hypothetical protein
MKKITFNYLLIILVAAFVACKQDIGESDPHHIRNYFVFLTSEGNDFFDSDTRYDLSKITFSCRQLQDVKIINGLHTFELFPGSCESIINFGNGDLDTLKMVWEPGVYGTPTRSEDLIRASFFYNGLLIDTWDFSAVPRLINELGERNVPDTPDWSNNLIIITIPKQADEGELN